MRLPALLLRNQKRVHKNTFGHVFILAGSKDMLGAAALTSLAAMRSGVGLVTVGIPTSLNTALQKKISSVVMTCSLPETKEQSLSFSAFKKISQSKATVLALGPGLSLNKETIRLVLEIVKTETRPLILDADALNSIALNPNVLKETKTLKILTPHFKEMSRLTRLRIDDIKRHPKTITVNFSRKYNVITVLKGARSLVASKEGKVYLNHSGNAGMATAGSGDVLTGIIAGLLAQGIEPFQAACLGCSLHGQAGDLSAQQKTKVSMIATDIIEAIPEVFKKFFNQQKIKSSLN